MKRLFSCFATFIAIVSVLTAEEPISLFDGKTFEGWEGDTQKMFRIEDGAIVGGTLSEKIQHNVFLTSKKPYTDFVLRLKFKLLGKDPNAGVQIRSKRIADHHEMIGYQADMGQQYWGCLYDESRRRKVLAQADLDLLKRIVKKDDWNTYEIHCEGKRVILKINGEVTVDYTEPDDSIEQEGLIGLQIHSGAPSEAWYKDITIEELAHPSEIISIWMDLAPGETEKRHGKARPPQEADPTITRVEGITHPTMEVFTPEDKGNGAAVVILPGGGFRYVVPNLEGSEAGAILNQLGITVFVLNYRTTSEGPAGAWRRPLQDSQRAIRYVRANAARWNLDQNKVGLLAFSAGGQVGAIHIGDLGDAYEPSDAIDQRSARPDFAMLVYPWRLADAKTNELMPEIQMSDKAPPTFLVHTHDDNSSSVGTALVYLGLKKHNVSAELHVYQNGGHGYGVRARPNSNIGTWSDRAVDWLRTRGLGEIPESSSH